MAGGSPLQEATKPASSTPAASSSVGGPAFEAITPYSIGGGPAGAPPSAPAPASAGTQFMGLPAWLGAWSGATSGANGGAPNPAAPATGLNYNPFVPGSGGTSTYGQHRPPAMFLPPPKTTEAAAVPEAVKNWYGPLVPTADEQRVWQMMDSWTRAQYSNGGMAR